jgi:septal ring factor EnvC (AmiA/AmiB activator)
LDDLKKRLSETEASHNEASDALAASEAAISKVNRRLRNLGSERARVENRLKELREQERAVSGQLTDAEKQIRVIAQAQYLNTQRDSWQTLIAGSNPHEIARDAAALRYFAQAEERAAHRLAYRQANIQSVSEETLTKRKELANIESREREDRAQLVKDQADRKQALTKLQKQISEQRASIDKMERDQARLGELVANIDKLLAKQKAEAQRLAEKARQQQKTGKSVASGSYVPPLKGQFAKLKGRLMMPALGKIVGRFGQARANVSGKSTTWKGLQIQAKQGSDVLACAAGQVVFSDWLRGFGNLIIIDHGDGFLSIYGNNESLYKSVGDRIQRGDTIASVGNTGGEDLPGLYFELRHNGRPFNPLPWIGKE